MAFQDLKATWLLPPQPIKAQQELSGGKKSILPTSPSQPLLWMSIIFLPCCSISYPKPPLPHPFHFTGEKTGCQSFSKITPGTA